jgi:hypothetical protein
MHTTQTPTTGYGYKDSDNFYYGMGVAPGIRIGSTKIIASQAGLSGTVAQWTTSAITAKCNTPSAVCTYTTVDCAATAQNFSNNEYDTSGTNAGYYSTRARDMDVSVRDADHGGGLTKQLAITVAAGNYGQNAESTTAVMAPATAKNVLSLGAAESMRASTSACDTVVGTGNNPALRNRAEAYNVLAYCSRRGTNDARIKPDLIAPATLVFGARTVAVPSGYCLQGGNTSADYYPHYHGASGTSFAAPVAAGAIALLRYHYSTTYGVTPSPALYKAMLVAGARSITGSLDRLETYLQQTTKTVTSWPNAQQGFGLITLNDLLATSVSKDWRDQDTVLVQGTVYDRTVTVTDISKPVKIVMAYTDAPAAVGAAITQVNGLNVTAFWVDGTRYYGNFTGTDGYSRVDSGCGRPVCSSPADTRNNVEVIHINPTRFAGNTNLSFTVRIVASPLNGAGVPGQSGGANNQDFALFVLNGDIQ